MNISEQYRAECEARYWLSRGYVTPVMVERLREEIRLKRGLAAANYLIENMRVEFRKRLENEKRRA